MELCYDISDTSCGGGNLSFSTAGGGVGGGGGGFDLVN
jgi:hypothetical protein